MDSYDSIIPEGQITFLGGGPTTLSALIFLAKNNRLYEFASKKGLIILERSNTFGSGNFERKSNAIYLLKNFFISIEVIPTIEPALVFLNLILVEPINLDELSRIEKIKLFYRYTLSPLKELLETFSFSLLLSYGSHVVPASLASLFLKMTGNSLLRYIELIGEREFEGGRRKEMRDEGRERRDQGGNNKKESELVDRKREGGEGFEERKKMGEGKRRRRRMIGGVEVFQINLLNGGDMLITAKNLNDGKFERIKTKFVIVTNSPQSTTNIPYLSYSQVATTEGFLSFLKSLSNLKDKDNKKLKKLDISQIKKGVSEERWRMEEKRELREEKGRKKEGIKEGAVGKKNDGRNKVKEEGREKNRWRREEKEKRVNQVETIIKKEEEEDDGETDFLNKEIILFGDLRKCLQIAWLLLNGPVFCDLSEVGDQINTNFSKRRINLCAYCQLSFDACLCYGELNFSRNEEWKKNKEMLPNFKKRAIQILIDKNSQKKISIKNSNTERNSQNELLIKKSVGENLEGELINGDLKNGVVGNKGNASEKKKESGLNQDNSFFHNNLSFNSKNTKIENLPNENKSTGVKINPSMRSLSPSKSKENDPIFEICNTPNFKNIRTEGVLQNLINEILIKKEKRVIFIENEDILKQSHDKNKIFIDCTNKYQHNLIIKDLHGKNIGLLLNEDGSIVVNEQKKLITENGVLKNIFGLGEGFKTRKGENFNFLNGEKDFHFILDTMSLMEEEFNGQWTWFESEYSSDNSQKKKKNLIFEESNSSGSEIFDLTGVNVRHLTKKLQIDQKLFKNISE